jgi:hypothetical protein
MSRSRACISTSLQSGIKSSYSIALMYTISRQILASASTNQVAKNSLHVPWSYFIERVCKVVLQKSTPAKLRRLFLCISNKFYSTLCIAVLKHKPTLTTAIGSH